MTLSFAVWLVGYGNIDLRGTTKPAYRYEDQQLASRLQFIRPATIVIDNITREDAGLFRCRIEFGRSPTKHLRHKLNVVDSPSVPIIYDSDIRIVNGETAPYDEGSDLTLTCEVSGGDSTVRVRWWRNNVTLLDDVMERSDNSYHLNELRMSGLGRSEDGSVISCVAEAAPGLPATRKDIRIRMNLRPVSVEILSTSHTFLVNSGEKWNVTCLVVGSFPPPIITWWLGNVQIQTSFYRASTDRNVTISALYLTVDKEDSGKKLTCRAENPAIRGTAIEDAITVEVAYPPNASVMIGSTLDIEYIIEGVDVFLECVIDANPSVDRINWFRNGALLRQNLLSGMIMSNNSLALQKIQPSMSGNFGCSASNRLGEGASATLPLLVKYSPVCKTENITKISLAEGETVSLKCEVFSDPPKVSFRWTMATGRETALIPRIPTSNAQARDSDVASVLEFTPKRDSDFGSLQCWASNSVGNMKKPCIFELVKEGFKPPPLTQCALEDTNPDSLQVICSEPSLVIESTNYMVEVIDANTGQTLSNLTSSTPRFVLRGLDRQLKILAVVSVITKYGRSEPVSVERVVERAVGSRAAEKLPEPQAVGKDKIIVITVAISVLCFLIILLGGAIFAYNKRQTRNAQQRAHQAKINENESSLTSRPDMLPPGGYTPTSDGSLPEELTRSKIS